MSRAAAANPHRHLLLRASKGTTDMNAKTSRRLPARSLILAANLTAAAVPAAAEEFTPPPVYTLSPMGVEMQYGLFTHAKTDLSIGGLELKRFYLWSPGQRQQYFGKGWSHSFDIHLIEEDGGGLFHWPRQSIILGDQTAAQFDYMEMGDGSFKYVPLGQISRGTTLTKSGGRFVFTDRSGAVFTFAAQPNNPRGSSSVASQLADTIVQADGQRLDFEYNGAGQLKAVLSNRGHALVFDYGSNGFVAAACGYNRASRYVSAASTCAAASAKVQYQYGVQAQGTLLTKVIDLSGQPTGITYHGTEYPLVKCIRVTGSATSCEVTNSYIENSAKVEPWRVVKQVTATGDQWGYNYFLGDIGDTPDWPATGWTNSFGDPEGGWTRFHFEEGSLDYVRNSEGQQFEFKFVVRMLTKATFPEGNVVDYLYDWRNNLRQETRKAKPSADGSPVPADIVIKTEYPGEPDSVIGTCEQPMPIKLCNKPLYTVDARGGRTDFTYDERHGGVLTETGPAAVAGGPRPLKRYAYAKKFAGVKDASGALVQEPTGMWVMIEEAQCRTDGDCAAADEERIAYEYGASGTADALLPKGKVVDPGGLNLRTCYRYDQFGNKISETAAKAGLAACP